MKLRLQKLLVEYNISQKDLSVFMKVRIESINRWCNNRQTPSLDRIDEILSAIEEMLGKDRGSLEVSDILERKS